jgi:two-component system, NarL family, response regulator DevR
MDDRRRPRTPAPPVESDPSDAAWRRSVEPDSGRETSPPRVFVVEDHEVTRLGIRTLLEHAGLEVVGEAGTAAEALQGIRRTRPDVALIEVRIPGGDGIQVIREIHSEMPSTRCLILTSFPDEEAFYHAVVAGAAGYLVKDVAQAELVSAVHEVAAGRSLVDPTVIEDLRRRSHEVPPGDRLLDGLTPQERKILELITEGYTNREIAGALFLAEKTVRNYVSNVLAKLGMKNRTQVAAYVAGRSARAQGDERHGATG